MVNSPSFQFCFLESTPDASLVCFCTQIGWLLILLCRTHAYMVLPTARDFLCTPSAYRNRGDGRKIERTEPTNVPGIQVPKLWSPWFSELSADNMCLPSGQSDIISFPWAALLPWRTLMPGQVLSGIPFRFSTQFSFLQKNSANSLWEDM